MKQWFPDHELFCSGHAACAGCGAAQAIRFVLKGLGRRTIMVVVASCTTPIAGVFPFSAFKIPAMHIAFECGGAAGAGVRSALEAKKKKDVNVLVWAGDGGTFDIGLQSLSGAAERNDDLIYVCYDNEAYMNTGIQRSSATPLGSWTTTTPTPVTKSRPKKDIMAIMASHGIPYAATATPGYPEDLIAKVTRAAGLKGLRFIHLLAPCPTGWRFPSELTVKLSRLAVETRVFPLYEVTNGEHYTINRMSDAKPVEQYCRLQGRFGHLSNKDIEVIQNNVDRSWDKLMKRVGGEGR
jgi:pyruvate/2-oxoacid:ferredoxin oxidoreductase beta subunit